MFIFKRPSYLPRLFLLLLSFVYVRCVGTSQPKVTFLLRAFCISSSALTGAHINKGVRERVPLIQFYGLVLLIYAASSRMDV